MTRRGITLLWMMLLATVSSVTVQAQVSEQDSLALVALYTTTDGPDWADNTNWLMTPVSQWKGVTVSGNRMTNLRLNGNQLAGSIPPELGSLNRLTGLFLYNNLFKGTIPSELGTLSNLIFLDLSDNQFTGSIPPELGSLNRLTGLFLHNNQLTESIPPELGSLSNLSVLFLAFNQLTGTIPPELGNLTNLTSLSLAFNQLTGGIPPELGNLTNLTSLSLNNTALSGTLPLSLTNLSKLETFWYDNTDLCEPFDPAFQTWLKSINNLRSSGCTLEIPSKFALEANYPNPFHAKTLIRYALPEQTPVRHSVYDVRGRRVAVLVAAEQPAGRHEVAFEASALPSGVYFYHFEADVFRAVRPMLLLR